MRITTEKVIEFMESHVAFNRYLGVRVMEMEAGHVVMKLPFRNELVGDPFRPALHGGVVSTLLDTCGGAAVWSAAEDGDRVSTVDLRVDFLRPGPLEDLLCDATVLRMGNRVGVADMHVSSVAEPDRVIASGKGVYNISRRPD